MKDVKVVAFDSEVFYFYGEVVRPDDATQKILQLCVTVQTEKSKASFGNTADIPSDTDGIPFDDFQILLQTNRTATPKCLGSAKTSSAGPPNQRLSLLHLGDGPHMFDVDVFFAVPANTSQVKFKFGKCEPQLLKIPSQ